MGLFIEHISSVIENEQTEEPVSIFISLGNSILILLPIINLFEIVKSIVYVVISFTNKLAGVTETEPKAPAVF